MFGTSLRHVDIVPADAGHRATYDAVVQVPPTVVRLAGVHDLGCGFPRQLEISEGVFLAAPRMRLVVGEISGNGAKGCFVFLAAEVSQGAGAELDLSGCYGGSVVPHLRQLENQHLSVKALEDVVGTA